MLKLFTRFFKDEAEKEKFSSVIIPSFIIHFFAAILAVALWLTLTRTLGTAGYGVYTFSFSIIFLLVNLATYGVNLLVVREIPSLLSTGKIGLAKGYYKWSLRIVIWLCIGFSLLTSGLITVGTYWLHFIKETVYTLPILFAITTVPFSGLMNFYSASLRGRHKTVLSLLPDNIIRPVAFLLPVLILFGFTGVLTLQNAILLTTFSFFIASAYSFYINKKTQKSENTKAEYAPAKWKKLLKSVFLLTAMLNINAQLDIIVLGFLKSSSEVGIYSLTDNIAGKLAVFLTIMNLISAATIARMHSLNEKEKLQKLITQISRWVMAASTPLFLFILFFSRWILSFFGHEFEKGQTALIILCIGQLINIAFGPVGNLSVMTNNVKSNILFLSLRLAISFILMFILTPLMGINGTAIAITVSIIVGNAGMFLTIKKKTGIKSWILG